MHILRGSFVKRRHSEKLRKLFARQEINTKEQLTILQRHEREGRVWKSFTVSLVPFWLGATLTVVAKTAPRPCHGLHTLNTLHTLPCTPTAQGCTGPLMFQ